ncbi:hypothetical protein BJX70DRAFT_169705 [Aspergillus crustosus]
MRVAQRTVRLQGCSWCLVVTGMFVCICNLQCGRSRNRRLGQYSINISTRIQSITPSRRWFRGNSGTSRAV